MFVLFYDMKSCVSIFANTCTNTCYNRLSFVSVNRYNAHLSEESIVLQSMIAGLAGSLSTFAQFIIEILSLIDPIIFKFDGVVYSIITVLLALVVGFLESPRLY